MNKEFKNIAASISYVSGKFYADDEEIKVITRHLNKDVQKEITNPAVLFVKDDLANSELVETKIYNP